MKNSVLNFQVFWLGQNYVIDIFKINEIFWKLNHVKKRPIKINNLNN